MPLSPVQNIQIQALHDYVIHQFERIEPMGIIRLLDNIKICFSVHTTTAQLAEQFRNLILAHWARGNLTRRQLILYSFPMLYESCINLVHARRRLLAILRHPCMNDVLQQRRHRS